MKNWIEKSKSFISETISETKKASFPSKEELISTTIVVLVTSAVFAVFLAGTDAGIQWVIGEVFGR